MEVGRAERHQGVRAWREIPPGTVLKVLLLISAGLTLISAVARVLRWTVIPRDGLAWRVALFLDVNLERNVPSAYNALLLLAAGGLLLYVARAAHRDGRPWVRHWAALGGIFVFLSADELLEVHELLTEPVRELVGASGIFLYAWVIPYALLAAAVGVAYLRFLAHLPGRIRRLFLAAGATYVFGALVLEMAVGQVVTTVDESWAYQLAALEEHVEEFLEMAGASLFVFALLTHIRLNPPVAPAAPSPSRKAPEAPRASLQKDPR